MLRAVLTALLLAGWAPTSHGAPVLATSDRPLGAPELERIESNPLVVPGRYRLARLDRGALTTALRNGGPLVLNLFQDSELTGLVGNLKVLDSGSKFATGVLAGGGHFSLLLHASGIVRGEFHAPGRVYILASARADSDHVLIREEDHSGVPLCYHDTRAQPGVPAHSVRGARHETPGRSGLPTNVSSALSAVDTEVATAAMLDVLVVYTQRVEDHLGGLTEVEAAIENEMAKTNQVLENSALAHRQMRLAAVHKVDYVQEDGGLGVDRLNLVGTTDGPLDGVHRLRQRHRADLVHLFVRDIIGSCGQASATSLYVKRWLEPSCAQHANPARCVEIGFRGRWRSNNSLSVSSIKCLLNYAFTHELGHSLGLWHDRAAYTWYDDDVEQGHHPLRPYAFGHQNGLHYDGPDTCQLTVMSYGRDCIANGITGQLTVPYFSNPDLFYPRPDHPPEFFDEETPMGVPGDEYTIDLDGPVDASRAIDDVWDIVASLSELGSPMASDTPLPPAELTVGGDPLQVDLDTLFVTGDGGTLTYAAESSDPAIAAVGVDGSTLQIDPKSAGTAAVTITATADNGDQAVRTLDVTVGSGAPRATDVPLPPARLTAGGDPMQVDLAALFVAGDGGELTYAAESSAPDIASARVDGATLHVDPGDAGTAAVTITATARNGTQATRVLSVTVDPPPPTVSEVPLPPTELTAGGDPMQVDLAALFVAGDGGELAYAAESSDTGIAGVEVEGATLRIVPGSAGTATVTITATARNGAYAERTLLVTVRFDHGDTPETASLLSIGPPLPGNVGGEADTDVFRIDLQGRAILEVRTSGPTDTRGELLDGTGVMLASDDDSGPAGHNFLVRSELGAGIYYVAVTGEPGDYAVMARLGDAPDHGETEATATLLTLYAEADLGRVSPSALLAAPGRIAPTSADVDVFRLDVPLDATTVAIRSAGGTDVFGRLLDSSMTELAADVTDGNFRMEAALDAGIYYVVVTGSETGTYRVLAWGDSASCACAAPAATDRGGTAEGSALMPIGPPLAGSLGDASDIDMFRIDLQGSATLEVRTSGPTDTRGELLDGTGARILSDDDSGPAGRNFLIRADLEAGIYYVAVRGEPGDYAVMARLGDTPDHGETPATATLLTLYTEADLGRVSPSALLAAPGKIAPTDGDVDVFRLDVPYNARDVTIRSAGSTNVYARLLDSSLTEIAADVSDGNFRITRGGMRAGIYYIEVRGRETGTYRVLARGEPQDSCGCAVDR